jgi:hypothetical protein
MARDPNEILRQFVPPIDAAVLRAFQEFRGGGPGESARVAADFFATQLPASVCQGDVLGPLPLLWYDTDGLRYEEDVLAMLISPSCDYDNDAIALFAPCFPLSRFEGAGFYASIIAQEKAALFYLAPTLRREGLVVDLSNIQPYPTSAVIAGLQTGSIGRVSSFTTLGYVGMMLKLTHHLLRPEAHDEIRGVSSNGVLERLRLIAREIRHLFRFVAPRLRPSRGQKT